LTAITEKAAIIAITIKTMRIVHITSYFKFNPIFRMCEFFFFLLYSIIDNGKKSHYADPISPETDLDHAINCAKEITQSRVD